MANVVNVGLPDVELDKKEDNIFEPILKKVKIFFDEPIKPTKMTNVEVHKEKESRFNTNKVNEHYPEDNQTIVISALCYDD